MEKKIIELKEDRERDEDEDGERKTVGKANSYYSPPDLRHIWNKADRVGFAPS